MTGLPTEPGDCGAPTRTCVGCRVRDGQDRLLRVVAGEGEVLPDPRRRLPGRGAYLHPRLACLAIAERKRAFPRAFRLPGPFAVGAVRARLEAFEAEAYDRVRNDDVAQR
ncbi:MAG TPA: YlxR family protein [Actinocrinis sp.]|uniref:YlxR family protein n=1 Tax=Actinocrinis sp. TaxID=1920516 RepID=UPI002DDD8BC9|nr:YlxR family protein [Actinocrinis sp.]HEV2344923.1 YlxR family protein [Actinocrinis sp.]